MVHCDCVLEQMIRKDQMKTGEEGGQELNIKSDTECLGLNQRCENDFQQLQLNRVGDTHLLHPIIVVVLRSVVINKTRVVPTETRVFLESFCFLAFIDYDF